MKTRQTKPNGVPKLGPCRCGRTPKLVQQERDIYSIECKCGVEFWLAPAKIGELSRELVAQEWNRTGR